MTLLRNLIFTIPLLLTTSLFSNQKPQEGLLEETLFPKCYIKVLGGSVVSGDFSAYSMHSMLRIDQIGSEAIAGAALGLRLDENLALEFSARHRVGMRYQQFNETVNTFEFHVGYLDSRTYTLAAIYELGKIGRAAPYVSLGGGIAYNTLRNTDCLSNIELGLYTTLGKGKKTSFTYFLGGGFLMDLHKYLKMDFNYSFFHLGKAQTSEKDVNGFLELSNIRTSEVSVGLIVEI